MDYNECLLCFKYLEECKLYRRRHGVRSTQLDSDRILEDTLRWRPRMCPCWYRPGSEVSASLLHRSS